MKLFDFSKPDATETWRAIDDRVMGGISQSELLAVTEQSITAAAFRGSLSLENNGGFCSVRSPVNASIPAAKEHLWIDCRNTDKWGEKLYSLNLRMSDGFDGISYRSSFTPKAAFARFEFTTVEFAPVFRGRPVPDAPSLKISKVQQAGLMISDAQKGPFELIVRAIGVN